MEQPTFELDTFTFYYPEQFSPTINNLSLTVQQGAFFVLCGPSGCGKSTLLRQLKSALSPHGYRQGAIYFEGIPLTSCDFSTQSQKIGFVQQSPENQIVTDKVWHELAFGLESLGYDTPTIRRRVAEMASFFGIEGWFDRDVVSLSGGQKQLLNLASVMAMQPSVLILDEPTSQLDPIAANDFLATLGRLNRELGTTIILTEHRLEQALPLATHVAVMDHGKLIATGTAIEVGQQLKKLEHSMFLAMPTPMRIWAAVENNEPCPITVGEGRHWLSNFAKTTTLHALTPEVVHPHKSELSIDVNGLWFRYSQDSSDVVKELHLQVYRGEFVALLGGNGTGKTTTLKLIAGLQTPQRGSMRVNGTLGVLPQNPQTLFVKKTVREDLFEVFEERPIPQTEVNARITRNVRLCHLSELLDRHPYDLSGGEQQRVALCKVLLLSPDILLLDEPTKGFDAEFKREFAEILHALLRRDTTILMISHDVEFCASYAHRCALFFDGNIVTQDRPRRFFANNHFYTTAASRMARTQLPDATTMEDVILSCGGTLPPPIVLPAGDDIPPPPGKLHQSIPPVNQPTKVHLDKRTLLAAFMILLLIPLTLYVGIHFLHGQKYYFISLLILLECMAPFFLLFEGRNPQARELVIIAVLCAIAVAGRAIFFMFPQFKPVTALCIISGVALGGEAGFLVGAMTMLTSNILLGQGPWTPWQMFAMGIIGFLAGILFRKGLLRRRRLPLSIFGALSCIVIYGGIMNPTFALLSSSVLDSKIIFSYLISGLPMDVVHATATTLFLWFGAEPMLEKLDRIKVKYGLLTPL